MESLYGTWHEKTNKYTQTGDAVNVWFVWSSTCRTVALVRFKTCDGVKLCIQFSMEKNIVH